MVCLLSRTFARNEDIASYLWSLVRCSSRGKIWRKSFCAPSILMMYHQLYSDVSVIRVLYSYSVIKSLYLFLWIGTLEFVTDVGWDENTPCVKNTQLGWVEKRTSRKRTFMCRYTYWNYRSKLRRLPFAHQWPMFLFYGGYIKYGKFILMQSINKNLYLCKVFCITYAKLYMIIIFKP